ncbi:hypothetical protein phiST2_0039 [Vibrio phage phi-ST2]|uniref:Uncharacterized protein n=1 Tax=Vibrio phage VH7D TaxID=1262539 RepID=V9LZU3_9CAUD|nr:hypothetical protein CF80_gp056 [Vibrio phage VH7D]ALP47701.1 hypothetical protein phiST2_0039 [Vibrio phage phi-ST2]QBX06303.1 hypothetical protein Va3_350 [Vibrio phage Va3]QNJ54546.1 hypothetical protein vBValMR10Z_5 [Vibrio phage vB_ValM_R10Z]QNJ54931.1 hypothetical protein vBValMR11Z_5 [Vibrio phage vB_ValM_R11Z]URQ03753.1 hypothetical protein PVA23_376 [Vibrio phage PVA23]
MKLPEYLQHIKVNENVITVDSARDKALVIDYLQSIKARFHTVQKTVSRCEIHVKRA